MANIEPSSQHKKAAAALVVGLVAWSFLDAGGFVLGCLVGYLLWEHREAAARQERLEQQVWELVKQVRLQGAERGEAVSAGETSGEAAAETMPEEGKPSAPPEERAGQPVSASSAPLQPEQAPPPRRTQSSSALRERVDALLYRGNVLVRAGVVILFFGRRT